MADLMVVLMADPMVGLADLMVDSMAEDSQKKMCSRTRHRRLREA
jgi:hypothetical protein